jgi:quercetin dioxygenase-like cupin family protein
MRIASALDVALGELFVEPDARPAYVLTRAGEGRILTRDGSRYGYAYEALALDMPNKGIEPFLLTIQPDDPVGRFQHGGQEFIYVLAGKIEFTVGDARLTLGPGDSLYFDPTHVHTTRVLGKKPARFLCTFVQDPPPRSSNGRTSP